MQSVSRLAALLPALWLAFSVSSFATDPKKPEPAPLEQKFAATLIWGTDDEKPENSKHDLRDVQPALKDKFKNIFKWKNYFQVGEPKPFGIHVGETKQLQLSHKCEVKVHMTEHEGMEVELIGEGKSVVKRKQPMPLKDILILAGDDKNATAWFVVLKPE